MKSGSSIVSMIAFLILLSVVVGIILLMTSQQIGEGKMFQVKNRLAAASGNVTRVLEVLATEARGTSLLVGNHPTSPPEGGQGSSMGTKEGIVR